MRFLQPSLSSAASRASSHVSSNPRKSSRMVSGQLFLGFPLPHFRPGVQYISCLALLFLFILATWPNHVSPFLLMMQPSSSCLVLSLIVLFGMMHRPTEYSHIFSKFIHPHFRKIYKLSPLFSFKLRFFAQFAFCFPLFWAWCIMRYALHVLEAPVVVCWQLALLFVQSGVKRCPCE